MVELLLASTILVMIAGALAALATAVQVTSQHNAGMGQTLQHGRVAMERIQRALNEATANERFPGFVVFSERINGWDFPDTLVVWHTRVSAADPDGMPLMSELVVFCPDPAEANRLLEITLPDDNRPAPALSDATAWQAELDHAKTGRGPDRVLLTEFLRVAAPPETGDSTLALRGAARFLVRLRPSESEMDELLAGTRAWDAVSWVQGIRGTQSGLCQAWCCVELQLRPANVDDNSVDAAIPFLGSGTAYFPLSRPDGVGG